MRTLVPTIALAFVTACAGAGRSIQPTPPATLPAPGTLIDANERPISTEAFAERAARARFVLVGENHGNACDHQVQAAVVRALAARAPAVGLEMVDIERQPVLDRFHLGALRTADLEEALSWKETWGVDFSLYAPIFEAAEMHQLPVIALNLPHEVVREVSRSGVEAVRASGRVGLPEIIPPPPDQEPYLRTQWSAHRAHHPHGAHGGHHGEPDEASFERFELIQSLWDSQMAQVAARWSEANGNRPVVILTGAGHVQNGWGIEYRLEHFTPGAEVLSILPWRGGEAPDPAAADLFFYCPARH